MPDRVRQRMLEYERKQALLTGYYKARGVVRPVNGVGTVDEVEKRIVQALQYMPGGIEIKTRDEIAYMREASLIVYEVLDELTRAVAPGVTLEELDSIAERETVRRGGVCAFKGLYGFPKNICISVNEQVVHGIPTRRKLVEGDLLKLDYGVIKHGYYGDSARTGSVGEA